MPSLKDWVFHVSPLWAKGSLLGMHSYLHAAHKYGRIYRQEVAALRRHAGLAAAELDQVQRQRLGEFLKKLHAGNAYFRAMMLGKNFDAAAIDADPVAALLSLSILEKQFL